MVVLPGETALQVAPYTNEWDEGFEQLCRQRFRSMAYGQFLACSLPQQLRDFSPSWAAYSAVEAELNAIDAELNAIGWTDAHGDPPPKLLDEIQRGVWRGRGPKNTTPSAAGAATQAGLAERPAASLETVLHGDGARAGSRRRGRRRRRDGRGREQRRVGGGWGWGVARRLCNCIVWMYR